VRIIKAKGKGLKGVSIDNTGKSHKLIDTLTIRETFEGVDRVRIRKRKQGRNVEKVLKHIKGVYVKKAEMYK